MEENKGLIEIGHGETTEQLPIIADDRLIEIAEKAEKFQERRKWGGYLVYPGE